jgi:hypothetical protein
VDKAQQGANNEIARKVDFSQIINELAREKLAKHL